MEQLKRLREARGLSQTKLAARADVNPATVNQIEGGKRTASPATLHKLAAALDVSLYELIEGEPGPLEQPRLPDVGEEQRSSILTDALVAAADTWLEAVSNPDINIHKRFGYRDAAIDLFDRINERAIGELRNLPVEASNKIVRAMGKLNEIPEAAYRAMPDETHKEALEERRRKMREWTRRIA